MFSYIKMLTTSFSFIAVLTIGLFPSISHSGCATGGMCGGDNDPTVLRLMQKLRSGDYSAFDQQEMQKLDSATLKYLRHIERGLQEGIPLELLQQGADSDRFGSVMEPSNNRTIDLASRFGVPGVGPIKTGQVTEYIISENVDDSGAAMFLERRRKWSPAVNRSLNVGPEDEGDRQQGEAEASVDAA